MGELMERLGNLGQVWAKFMERLGKPWASVGKGGGTACQHWPSVERFVSLGQVD